MFTWRGRWIGTAGWQTGALSCAPVGLAGAARNSSGGCREQHEVCCSWWSFPGLASFALSRMVRRRLGGCRCLLRSRLSCRRSSAAPCTRRRTGSALAGAMRAPAGAIPTGEAKDPYVFPLRRDAGSFAASCGVGVAGAAGRRRSCARFISGAFRRAQGHRIASVLCVMARLANRRGGALRRRRSWSSVEEQGQAGLHRAPGAAEHRPGMDRGCGAQPQVGNAVDGKRTGEDHYETVSLAGIRSSTVTTGRSLPSTPRRPSAHPRRAPHHPRG